MSLNLHALAVEVLRDSATPEPDAMAAVLVGRIEPEHYREALTYLAKSLIRQVIHDQRAALNGGAPRQGSKKVAAVRDAWKRMLDTPEYVPSTGWLFLRDASRDQVLEMAGLRRLKAQELTAAAQHYRRLAEAMAAADVASVGDLPDDTLENLLSPVAKVAKVA